MLSWLTLLPLLMQAPAPSAEALEAERQRVEQARALDPEDPELLFELARVHGQAKDVDRELAYLLYAWEAFEEIELDDAKAKEDRIKAIEARVKALDPSSHRLTVVRDEYLKDLAWSLKLYAENQKKPRNALEVAGRILRYRPSHRAAQGTVKGILAQADPELRREAEFLLGVEELRRSRSYRRRWAEQHRDWSQAPAVTRSGYTVRSNIGVDTLHRSATVLEQIADFYREFYGIQGDPGSTDVFLCRTRAEYEAIGAATPMSARPDIRGFITGLQMTHPDGRREFQFTVYSYDPRDDGFPLDSLYWTLFHEASHQYMTVRAGADQTPSWLNEGMACYFEGVRIGPDGRIAIGLPAMRRLHDLYGLLPQGAELLRATLAAKPLQDGRQYAVAWGLVYHLYHARDEDGRHPQRPLLEQMIQRCASSGASGTELFESVVLGSLGLTFDAFFERWSSAIRELWELESDPRRAAEHHRTRAEGWLTAGHRAAATDGFRHALLRESEDPRALLGLAQITAGSKDRDDRDNTLLWARRAHASALERGEAELAKTALALADDADPAGFKKLLAAESGYRKDIGTLVERHLAAGRPHTALALTRRYLDGVLGESRFDALGDELRAKGTLRLERTLLPFDGRSLSGLSAAPSLYRVEAGELTVHVQRPYRAPLFLEEPVAALFRWSGEIQLGDGDPMVAILLSEPGALGTTGFILHPARPKASKETRGFHPFDTLEPGSIGTLREGYNEHLKDYDFLIDDPQPLEAGPAPGTWCSFVLRRDELGVLRLELDGKPVRTLTLPAGRADVRPGLLVYGGGARIRNLRVLEIGRP